MARISGMPAATSAPNVISRISSVIGSEVVSAFCRSPWTILSNAFSELAVAELLDAHALVGAADRRGRGERPVDGPLGRQRGRLARDLEPDQRRVAVGRDLPAAGLAVGAVDLAHASDGVQTGELVVDGGPERRVIRRVPGALDHDRLVHLLGVGPVDDHGGLAGLADARLGLAQGVGADVAADHEGEDHERDPAEDGGLAVFRAPVAGASGDVSLGLHGLQARRAGPVRSSG